MKTFLLDIIAGARPNFVKIAPIISAIKQLEMDEIRFNYRLVHTGQHYDPKLSGSFFEQLGIPKPDVNLEVGSGTQAEQTAAIMIRYEELLLHSPSTLCLVVGDVNSTMACSLVAKKMGIPVAHVEAGIRSGDMSMPEEINRIVTDAIADYFFTTTEEASYNLRTTGISNDRIFFVGNTMIDTLLANKHRLRKPDIDGQNLNLEEGNYFVLTLHRPSNVDTLTKLNELLAIIADAAGDVELIFPVHPRTAKKIKELKEVPKNLNCIGPQSYLEFNWLVKHSMAVITDSGGITEEATVMGIPCLTLRNSTERPETVSIGTNELIGDNYELLTKSIKTIKQGNWKKGSIPYLWDGNAALRIVDILKELAQIQSKRKQ